MGTIKTLPTFPYRLGAEDKLYFLHIYKTAGTTLSKLLESRFQPDEVCPAHQLGPLARLSPDSLRRYRLYWGHLGFKLAELVPGPMIYVTMLRDPVEHVLSIYEAIRRSADHPLHERVNRLGMTLPEFLRDDQTAPEVRDQQVLTLTFWHSVWAPAHLARLAQDALTPADRAAIRREVVGRFRATPGPVLVEWAQERLDRFAFVGLVERMEESVRLLSAAFAWEPFTSVPRLNAAPQRVRKEDLSPGTLDLIGQLTRLDAQVYARAQRVFERRLREMRRLAANRCPPAPAVPRPFVHAGSEREPALLPGFGPGERGA
jgi:hypothetical protein